MSVQRTAIHEVYEAWKAGPAAPVEPEQPEQPAELTGEALARLEPNDWLSTQSAYWERRLGQLPH